MIITAASCRPASPVSSSPGAAEKTTPPPSLSPSGEQTVEPSGTPGSPIEFIASASLPASEGGDWYEWDKAGGFPSNQTINGSIFYIEEQDMLIRAEWSQDDDKGKLIVSKLDGTNQKILADNMSNDDQSEYYGFNYFDGWIYYVQPDGIYKVKPDGTENHKIISRQPGMYSDQVFIYGGLLYIIRDYEDSIESYDFDGNNHKIINVPDIPMGYYFFASGYLYYGAISSEDEGGDSWSIYRYNLQTGKSDMPVSDATGPVITYKDRVYYLGQDDALGTVLEYKDGKTTKIINGDEDTDWDSNYNLYKNYFFCFKNETGIGNSEGGTVCAIDADTGAENELFSLPDFYDASFFSAGNSVFIYTGCADDPAYRITFEGDQAKLWKLNGLNSHS